MSSISVKFAFRSIAFLSVCTFLVGCTYASRPVSQTEELRQYLESTINKLPGNYSLLQVNYSTSVVSVNYYNPQVIGDFLLFNMTKTNNDTSIGERASATIKMLLSSMNKNIDKCEIIHETKEDSLQICDISPTSSVGQPKQEYVVQWALRIDDKTAISMLHNNDHLKNLYTVTEKTFLFFNKTVGAYNQYFSKDDENQIAKKVSEIGNSKNLGNAKIGSSVVGKSIGSLVMESAKTGKSFGNNTIKGATETSKSIDTPSKKIDVIYSSKFLPKNYQEQLKKDLYLKLIDPKSAIFEWENFKPYKTNQSSKEVTYCYMVNSKNRYGGYAGWKLYMATFKNGILDTNTYVSKYGQNICHP